MPRVVVFALFAILTVVLPACDLLPQTGGEWALVLGICGVLIVVAAAMAWYNVRKNRKK